MRFLRVLCFYQKYLDQFYSKNPSLESLSYSEHLASLNADCFSTVGFWREGMSKLGYEASEIVANSRPLQLAWARENTGCVPETDWLLDILRSQITQYAPEILFVYDYDTFPAGFWTSIREECPSVRKIILWCGAPYINRGVFSEVDLVLSCIPEHAAHFRSLGLDARHMNHSFAPFILDRLAARGFPSAGRRVPDSQIAFVGSIFRGREFHESRYSLLKNAARKVPLCVHADVVPRTFRIRTKETLNLVARTAAVAIRRKPAAAQLLNRVPFVRRIFYVQPAAPHPIAVDPWFFRLCSPAVFGIDMYEALGSSAVALNVHIDLSSRSASNMRLYEATGIGACLLTEAHANLPALFAPDQEVVTYASVQECVEKARYLLSNPEVAREIGLAGQRRTLSTHTIYHRADEMHTLIQELL